MSSIALYQALKAANVSDTLAREAVEGFAHEADLSLLATKADLVTAMAEIKTAIAESKADLSRLIMQATVGGIVAMGSVFGTMLVIFKFWGVKP